MPVSNSTRAGFSFPGTVPPANGIWRDDLPRAEFNLKVRVSQDKADRHGETRAVCRHNTGVTVLLGEEGFSNLASKEAATVFYAKGRNLRNIQDAIEQPCKTITIPGDRLGALAQRVEAAIEHRRQHGLATPARSSFYMAYARPHWVWGGHAVGFSVVRNNQSAVGPAARPNHDFRYYDPSDLTSNERVWPHQDFPVSEWHKIKPDSLPVDCGLTVRDIAQTGLLDQIEHQNLAAIGNRMGNTKSLRLKVELLTSVLNEDADRLTSVFGEIKRLPEADHHDIADIVVCKSERGIPAFHFSKNTSITSKYMRFILENDRVPRQAKIEAIASPVKNWTKLSALLHRGQMEAVITLAQGLARNTTLSASEKTMIYRGVPGSTSCMFAIQNTQTMKSFVRAVLMDRVLNQKEILGVLNQPHNGRSRFMDILSVNATQRIETPDEQFRDTPDFIVEPEDMIEAFMLPIRQTGRITDPAMRFALYAGADEHRNMGFHYTTGAASIATYVGNVIEDPVLNASQKTDLLMAKAHNIKKIDKLIVAGTPEELNAFLQPICKSAALSTAQKAEIVTYDLDFRFQPAPQNYGAYVAAITQADSALVAHLDLKPLNPDGSVPIQMSRARSAEIEKLFAEFDDFFNQPDLVPSNPFSF